jgi:hypothetical protein
MWAVNNRTKFKAERAFARDEQGAEIWVVAVRATFSIDGDGPQAHVRVSDDQEDVVIAPKYFGEPGESSLRFDTDLMRTKTGTDVVLHAAAHAPGGRPARSVDVGVVIGPIAKRLRVVGERVWRKGWRAVVPTDPEPFVSLPIRYEHAWGGALADSDARDPFNPIGVGVDATPGMPVPSIEDIDDPIESARYRGTAAGFGPIPCDWQPRLGLAGTYDDVWQQERQPLVPVDFDTAYFRCAPADQQVDGFLRGGEDVVLHNLTPSGLLRFRLPHFAFGFRTKFDRTFVQHRGELHTVIIEPSDRRLTMVWQSALPCHHTLYGLTETLVTEKAHVLRHDGALQQIEPRGTSEPEYAG